MAVDINLITNCDDAIIFWRTTQRISECWGFMIDRGLWRTGLSRRRTLDFIHDAPQAKF